MAAIPPQLQTDELRFVLLGSSGDDLKKPWENEWQKTANYRHNDERLLNHIARDGNYGVAGGFGDIHFLDSDDLNRWQELGALALIPETFTIESRPGHRQFYLKCKNHFPTNGLFDLEKTEINNEGKPEFVHIGDLKAGKKDGICGGQAVGPTCRHPSGSIYAIVVDAPIAEVSSGIMKSYLSRFRTSKKVENNHQKREEVVKKNKHVDEDPFNSLRVTDIMPPAGNVSQSGDEVRGDHPVHGSTNHGNYVINIKKNLWHCKRCESGGGPALAIAVKHGLLSCSDAMPDMLR